MTDDDCEGTAGAVVLSLILEIAGMEEDLRLRESPPKQGFHPLREPQSMHHPLWKGVIGDGHKHLLPGTAPTAS